MVCADSSVIESWGSPKERRAQVESRESAASPPM